MNEKCISNIRRSDFVIVYRLVQFVKCIIENKVAISSWNIFIQDHVQA